MSKKASSPEEAWNTSGAENEIRTRDPRLGKAVLYRWAISAIGTDNMDYFKT